MRGEHGGTAVAFYCVADARYFLGAVALINSLRVNGHREPVFLLDAGLEPGQRELLSGEVTVVPAPRATAPHLLKTVAPLAHPAETMVLIDTDMIVTRPLGELIERAGGRRVVATADNIDRWDERWGELIGRGELERRRYLCSGLIAISAGLGARVFAEFERTAPLIDFERTFWRGNEQDYPFLYADQDLLNAILAAEVGAGQVDVIEHRLAPGTPFHDLEIIDAHSLACAYPNGDRPYVVHHILPGKPWLVPVEYGVYSRLMTRLLCRADVAISVPRRMVPRRLRSGPTAAAERQRLAMRGRLGWAVRKRLPEAWTRRVDGARDRRRSA